MTLAALCLAIAVASAVQVVSGFGFALIAAPVLVAVTDPVTSVSVLAVLGAVIATLTLTTGRHRPETLTWTSLALLAWALPGIAAGAFLVSELPDDGVRAAVGVLVIAALLQRRAAPRPWGRAALAGAGLTSGAMSTSTGLNGPPLVLYLTGTQATPRQTRDTLALLFLVLDVVSVGALAAFGNLELPTETLALPVAGLAGVTVGHAIFDRLDAQTFHRIVTATLVAAALTALGAAIG